MWIIAAMLAGLAGILWAYFRPGIRWDMGAQILLLIFAAVTLGGLGTALGALVGSLVVGLLVEVSSLWIPADLKYVGALVVLIVILLFRPQGILGRRESRAEAEDVAQAKAGRRFRALWAGRCGGQAGARHRRQGARGERRGSRSLSARCDACDVEEFGGHGTGAEEGRAAA